MGDNSRIDPERDALEMVIAKVLFNNINYPERIQKHILGVDTTPLREALADALQAAGFRQVGIPAPPGLCNIEGCSRTPHNEKVKHSWQ